MRFVVQSTLKDLRRRLADPLALLLWIGIPLVLGLVLSLVSSGGGTPTARLLVVDQDDSLLSGLIVGAASQGALEILSVETVDLEVGRERIGAGDGSALLVIPPGFSDAVLQGTPLTLELVTNPSQTILPGILEEGLEMLTEAVFYGQQILGPELREALSLIEQAQSGNSSSSSAAQVAAVSSRIFTRLQAAGASLFPPALEVVDEPLDPVDANAETAPAPPIDIARLFLPSMLFMSVLFVAQGVSSDLWKESSLGTLRRAVSSPQGVAPLLLGKILAGSTVMATVATVAILVAWVLFEPPLSRLPPALVWCAFAGGSLLSFFLALQSVASTSRGGNLVSTMVVFPLMMVGGSFFPFAAMPAWMRAIGEWTPNGLALRAFEDMMFGVPQPSEIGRAALVLILVGSGAYVLCLRQLRRGAIAR